MTTRRDFMAGSVTILAATALPPMMQAWATHSLSIGSKTINTISDGNLVLPGSFIFEPMPQDALMPILKNFDVSKDRLTPECNMTLIRDGNKVILFDVGSGPNFQPTAGKAVDALEALGLSVEDVTHIVFTHAHPDHLWGVLDDFGDPLFPNATHMMGKAEWDYWMDPKTVDTIGTARASFAVGAKRRLEVIEDAISFFNDGEEILPGIAARASFGHTPGHMAFEIRDGKEALMIVGDAIGNHHVAFEKPDWPSGSDQDQPKAAATRKTLLDQITNEQMRLIGFHLPGGGMGHTEKKDSGYRFVPEV